MSIIPMKQFDAEYESSDDNGKRHRHGCTVVGVAENDEFVVVAESTDGKIYAFRLDHVFPVEPHQFRKIYQ